MRRFIRILAGSFLLVFILAVLAVTSAHVFLGTDPGERFVLNLVNSLIPGRITCRDVSLSLFGQTLDIEDGRLSGPHGEEIVRARKLQARIRLLALLKNRIELVYVSAQSPRVNLVRHEDGTLNIMEALVKKEEKPEEKGFEFVLGDFRASDGSVSYDDEGVNLSTRLEGVGLAGAFDFPRTAGWASTTIRDARVDFGEGPVELKDASLSGKLAGETLDPVFVKVGKGSLQVSASGSIRDLFTRPDFDLVFDSQGETADLASLFGMEDLFTGSASGTVRFKGTVFNPAVSCRIAHKGGKVGGVPVKELNLEAGLEDRIVTVEKGEAAFPKGTMSMAGSADLRKAFPKGFFAPEADIQAVSYALTAQATNMDLKKIFTGVESAPETLSGKVSLKGKGIDLPHLTGSASYDLRLTGLPGHVLKSGRPVDIKGKAEIADKMLDVAAAAVVGRGARADGKARYDIGKGNIQADVALEVARFEELIDVPGVPVKGAFDARAQISGPPESPRIAASMQGRAVRYKDFHLGEVLLDAVLDQSGRVEVSRMDVHGGGSRLSAQGSVKVFKKGFALDPALPVDLAATLTTTELHRLAGTEELKGSFEGNARITGSLFNPNGTFAFTGKSVSYRDVTVGDMELQGGISQGIIRVPRLHLANKGSTLDASGRIDLIDIRAKHVRQDPHIELLASGDVKDLTSFSRLLKGNATFNADIRGSLLKPEGGIQAKGSGLTVWGQDLESFSLSALLDHGRVRVEPLEVVVAQGRKLTVTGWVGLEKSWPYAVALKSDGIDLGSFPVLGKYGVTGGKLTLDVSGQGVLEHPRLKGDALVTSLFVNGEPHKDVFAHFQLQDGKLNMLGESTFGFNGSYDLDTQDLDLQAIFKDTELEPYFRIAGRPELHGVLTGDAKMTGNARDIRDIDLDMRIAAVDIMLRQDRVISGADLSVKYHDRRLVVPRSRLTLMEQGSMVVQAQTDRNGSIDLTAQGLLPLEIVPLFVPDLEDLMGTVRFGLSLKGPVGNPAATGDIYLDDVRYVIPYNDQLVHGVNGHIRLEGNQALVQELGGRLDTGSFTIGGRVGLKGFQPVDIDLNARALSLPFVVPDTMSMVLEAGVNLSGTPDNTLLTGNAVILEGSYYRDVQLNLIAEVGQRITRGRVRAHTPGKPLDIPFLRDLELDVAVTRRGTVSIDNNLTDAAINPDLQITGTLNEPVITGRISVTQGTVTYQKRSFDITRGEIDFSNPYTTKAEVDVIAQGKVRDWTITLEVSGPLENLNINLTSVPAADSATIISLLATGKTPDELVGKPGAAASSPSSMLAEILANTYGEKVKRTTGLDILQLESGPQQTGYQPPGSETQDIRLTVGEKLTRRLTVKYSVTTGESELTRTTSAEYMLLENILLNGFQDSTGAFGGDVQFRLEFR